MILEKDVVVVGAGGAGLTTALVAAHHGLDVLLVEKTPWLGGATAWSGGNVWAPLNPLAQQAGITDDREAVLSYLQAVIGSQLNKTVVDRFLDAIPGMVEFFQQHTPVQFEVQTRFSDQYPELTGAHPGGRCITPLPFDGRKLDDWFSCLRQPLPQVNAPFGLMIGFDDIEHLQKMGKSLPSTWHVLKRVSHFLKDKLLYGRTTRLTMGNALAARLLRAALDAGVEIWPRSPVHQLLHAEDRVSGVLVAREGRPLQVHARRGVVLASGGFSANAAMRQHYIPYPDLHISHMPDGNSGDGIRLACAAGGVMVEDNIQNGDWIVSSVYTDSQGQETRYLHTVLDRPKPGCIAINQQGVRFTNEADRNMVAAMHATGSVPAYLVCDQRFIKKYGLGLVSPGGFGHHKYIQAGYLICAPDIAALASAIGVDANVLSNTIARFNHFAIEGVDKDFGKGEKMMDRSNGDSSHTPNPCLGALEQAPYFAVKIFPGDASTWAGLKVDEHNRVLRAEGTPVSGLYAAGLDANSIWRGHSPSVGSNNTLSLTFGYLTGLTLATSAEKGAK